MPPTSQREKRTRLTQNWALSGCVSLLPRKAIHRLPLRFNSVLQVMPHWARNFIGMTLTCSPRDGNQAEPLLLGMAPPR